MTNINGRPTQWLIEFDSNLEASTFVTTCTAHDIQVVGIAHDDDDTTVYFANEADLTAAKELI